MRPIALLTDFGTRDIYIGVMKGVMRGICPDVQFIDITHAIPPQAVREGALALRNSYRFFPAGTIFLVVVDPGVGSQRHPLAVKAGGYHFVAPDNGLLSYALAGIGAYQAVILENPRYRLPEVSATFHGRDVFAPAAAYLARGVEITALGSPQADIFMLPQPTLEIYGGRVTGEITHIDHFGNLLTSIGPLRRVDEERLVMEAAAMQPVRVVAEKAVVKVGTQTVRGIRHAYHEAARGDPLAQIDSNGYLEVAVNQGSAAARFQAVVGDVVELFVSGLTTSELKALV